MNFLKKIPFEIYLILFWGASILFVNPLGNFPLNDDWAYARSVMNLLDNGKLIIGDWPAMTLVGQTIYSAIFCKIFGFSFVTLRILSLIVSLIGILTFYKLVKLISSNKIIAAFASLLIFFNPLFFPLSFTFMTDVHFISIALLSIYFFFKFIYKDKLIYVLFASIFSVLATMIRQPGILIPFSFAIVILFKKLAIRRIIIAISPLLFNIIFLFIHYYLFIDAAIDSEYFIRYDKLITSTPSIHLYQIIERISLSILYIGLFLSPILLLFLNIRFTNRRSYLKLIIILPIILLLLKGGANFPVGNILYNLGLGPKVLIDSYLGDNVNPQINNNLWVIFLKTIAILSSVILFLIILQKDFIKKKDDNDSDQTYKSIKIFALISITGYILVLIIGKYYFDRYVIPLLVFFLILLIPQNIKLTRPKILFGVIGISIFAIFNLCATKDYLSWNRARWEAVDFLVEHNKIPVNEIDGGFEFNGWYDTGEINKIIKGDKSWWFVYDDKYAISFGEIKDYKKIKAFKFNQMLSSKNDSIYILKRKKPNAFI